MHDSVPFVFAIWYLKMLKIGPDVPWKGTKKQQLSVFRAIHWYVYIGNRHPIDHFERKSHRRKQKSSVHFEFQAQNGKPNMCYNRSMYVYQQ